MLLNMPPMMPMCCPLHQSGLLRIPRIPRNFIVQAGHAQAPTHIPSYIKPATLRLLHQACYAQAPTLSLLYSGSNICPILHQAGYAQAPTSSPQSYTNLLCSGSYIKPVMLRLQHMFHLLQACYDQAPYIITLVLYQACFAQTPTSSTLCSGSNICSIRHQACYPQAPTSCLLCSGPNTCPCGV